MLKRRKALRIDLTSLTEMFLCPIKALYIFIPSLYFFLKGPVACSEVV
jgi:hypothetical protein